MASLNKVILIGRLGKNPDIFSFENGNKKMSVSLATSETCRDSNGKCQSFTEWHNLVNYGNIANDIDEKRRIYVKGELVYVEGKIRTRQYVDSQNVTRNITEIVVDKMMSMNDSRQQNQDPNSSYNAYGNTGQAQTAPETPLMAQIKDDDNLPF